MYNCRTYPGLTKAPFVEFLQMGAVSFDKTLFSHPRLSNDRILPLQRSFVSDLKRKCTCGKGTVWWFCAAMAGIVLPFDYEKLKYYKWKSSFSKRGQLRKQALEHEKTLQLHSWCVIKTGLGYKRGENVWEPSIKKGYFLKLRPFLQGNRNQNWREQHKRTISH